jgi:hypothetical protein
LTSYSLREKLREVDTKRKGTTEARKGTAAVKDYVVVSRLDEDTHRRFKVYAAAQNRSISKQIRTLIQDVVSAHEEEAAA